MMGSCEAGEVFALLEGGGGAAALGALFAGVREPWLTRALLQYHARTGSARALTALARAPEPHARHLLDALAEQLREPAARRAALRALAPLLARRPAWLHRLPAHPLPRELLRAARQERHAPPLLHALLALAALLPAQPALAHAHWPELAGALLRPAAPAPPPARDHLLLARLALFRALYAAHPLSLLDALRAELAAAPPAAQGDAARALPPLLASVRLHPALVTGSRQQEADPARLARLELHDVVAEARRLSLPPHAPERERASPAPAPAPPAPAAPQPGSGAHAAREAAALRPGAEPWFPLAERCGADSAPPTPLPASPDAGEPPEAAVEATPENTPAEESRAQFRFPAESGAVRAIGRRSQPPSPLRKETSPLGAAAGEPYGGRLTRMALDRAALEAEGASRARRPPDSPVPFGGAPPPAGAPVARPEPRAAAPPDAADREVLELTTRARADDAWADCDDAAALVTRARLAEPRGLAPLPRPRRSGAATPPRRAASCGPVARTRTAEIAVQTVDVWPEPYEFIIADFYKSLPDDFSKESEESSTPCSRLDDYLSALYSGEGGAGAGAGGGAAGEAGEQLALVHAQLLYERWRREAHAERNRRLLGRCRQVRALELGAAALRDQLRAAARERDALRARLARDGPPAPPAAPRADHEARLEAALAEERCARARADAALREERAARAADRAELTRARGAGFDAARHVEALARAALAGERRGEHVRRLRRELLVLAEREARLAAGAAAGARAEAAARATSAELRLAAERLAAARADAEAAAARAEGAAARASELEAALAARDAVLAELRRAARAEREEGAARQRALQDKYEALQRVARAGEAQRLARLAAGEPAPAPR